MGVRDGGTRLVVETLGAHAVQVGLSKKAGSLRNPQSFISRKIGDKSLAVCSEVQAHAAVMMFDELAGLPPISVTVDWPFALPIWDGSTGTAQSRDGFLTGNLTVCVYCGQPVCPARRATSGPPRGFMRQFQGIVEAETPFRIS